MQPANRLIVLVFALLAPLTGACAVSPQDELLEMVGQLQADPHNTALRQKIIGRAQAMKPAPAVPEEARRAFIMGETLLKQAQSLKSAYRAAAAFRSATELAPWWGDAYWNWAHAEELAGRDGWAKAALKQYLLTGPGAADSRAAQDRVYVIEANALAAPSLPGGITGFWHRESVHRGTWGDDERGRGISDVYEIRQTGAAYSVSCLWNWCAPGSSTGTYPQRVISASANAIAFEYRYHADTSTLACQLGSDGKLVCTVTHPDGTQHLERYTKRSVCEDASEANSIVPMVLCK